MDVTTLARPDARADAVHVLWTRFVGATGGRAFARLLVAGGLGATLTATGMVIVLHLLPHYGGVNPVDGMLSDYALHPDGWVFQTALVLTGAGSVALWTVLVRHHVLRGWLPMLFMALWCAGLVSVAFFSKDAVETHQTIHGGIHLWITAVACAALPIVGLALGSRHRSHPDWRGFAQASLWLAVANVPCLLPFVIAFFLNVATHSERFSGPATGLIERVMSGIDVALVVLLGAWAYAAAHNRNAVLCAKRTRSERSSRHACDAL